MAPFTFYKIVEKKMESVYEMKKIAVMHSDFKEKFGIPRQSGLVEELESYIVFEPEYRNPDALRGLEGFSHIWILWLFSKNRRDHFLLQSGLPGWAEINGWGYLLRGRLFVPIPLRCPVWRSAGYSIIQTGDR